MLKIIQDHRNVDALFLAVSLAANLRVARRVQYRTNMRKAPDRTSPATYRLSKCLIVAYEAQTNHKRPHCINPLVASRAKLNPGL
jgi:hypothetical protein